MTHEFWESLVDSEVCGYRLGRLIGTTDSTAVYLTTYGQESATLKLKAAEASAPAVPPFDHPNLTRLFADGRCEVHGEVLHYFVTEYAEENLGSVVASRPLSAEEAVDLLKPVLEALVYLHGRDLAHGRIQPSNILAKGDTIKLSVDSVRRAGVLASPQEDMRALGLTIIEVLTCERRPSAIAAVAQPLRDIVEHALQEDPANRWTARQAALRLSGTPVPAGVEVVPKPRVPLWTFPAAGVSVLLVVLFLVRGSTPPPPPPEIVSAAPRPVVVEKPSPTAPPKPAAVSAPLPTGRGWFVVVASYTREPDAAVEARVLARRFPQFKTAVFPPSAIDNHYLVILGSGLTQEAAESLRQRAVASGMPPDTYIKKYPAGKQP